MENLRLYEEFINEFNDPSTPGAQLIRKLHLAQTEEEVDKIRKELSQKASWGKSDVDHMLRKYRESIDYDGPDLFVPDEKTTSTTSVSNSPQWTDESYQEWIDSMAWSEGEVESDYGYEMAQNAMHEPGLVDFVKKKINNDGGDESPLDRIQWDIEASMG